jgi:hypothetical protein
MMSGSTTDPPRTPLLLERVNFLESAKQDSAMAFESLENLDTLVGSSGLAQGKSLENFNDSIAGINEWRERLHGSRTQGVGFAAPGGFFTRSLYEAILLKNIRGAEVIPALKGRTLVELGAGCYHYGWMIASACYSSAYIGIEPFYADKLAISIKSAEEKYGETYPVPKSTVIPQDMKLALDNLPDGTACILACGIEDCILPNKEYREAVEKQIARILPADGLFISFQSDLHPKGLDLTEVSVKRVDSPHHDRLCLYRK